MDEKEAEARPLMGTIFLVIILFCNAVGRSIKLHLYWSMRNCGGDSEALRELVDAIPKHYQVFTLHKYSTSVLNNSLPLILLHLRVITRTATVALLVSCPTMFPARLSSLIP